MRKCNALTYISLPGLERYSSNRAPMITFNTYMTQFICLHHGILIREKITTYLDARGASKNNCFLCIQLIQAKNPDFTHERLYERVKLFSIQRMIGGFQKDFYIQQIETLDYHFSYYKILGKHHAVDVRHKSFESTPGNIITRSDWAKPFSFESGGQLQNEFFDNNRTLSMEGCCLDCSGKTVNVRNFITVVVVMFTNLIAQYGSFIYIYLIQSCIMPLQLQLISIHCWLGCMRKK